MNYTISHITNQLKAARKARSLSQRALGKLAGVPQSHISKIENGSVDLRLSSLIELARILGLEATLVPRKALPAINSIIRSTTAQSSTEPPDLERVRPAYNLDDDDNG